MDNLKVEVRDTNKYGKSLFAKDNIGKNEIIADWSKGHVYHAKSASELPNNPPDFIKDHAIQFAEDKYIDYDGIGRFFAHSCNPNCGFQGRFKVVAMREIKKGDELNFDYEMSEDSDWRMECICGNENCRKIIGAFRNMPEELRKKYNGYISEWLREKYNLK
jgi:uncharacterized protein